MANKFEIGAAVFVNNYPARVTDILSNGMIEVRGERGGSCIDPSNELTVQTAEPAIGDRVLLVYGAGCGEDVALVTGRLETKFGIAWEIIRKDGSRDTIRSYTGRAEDIGGDTFRQLNYGGIGAYKIVPK